MGLRETLAAQLTEARQRTEDLLRPVDDDRLCAQHDPLQSPLLWDYGHIGVFEELWLVSQPAGTPPPDAARMHIYDAFENPRRTRAQLPMMDRATATAYRDGVRARALSLLEEADLDSASDPLMRDGFVHSMIVQHEHQHGETLLQTLQLLQGGYLPALPPEPVPPPGRRVVRDMVSVPAGTYTVGCDGHAPYDNEHPLHTVELSGYAIDRYPVTCGDMAAFISDGGYSRPELWDEKGAAWLVASGMRAPRYWDRDGDTWVTDRFGHRQTVRMDTPVMHVCYHEAAAWARWAHRRLPTEQEWEVAATWDPAAGRARRHPWGDGPAEPRHANLDQRLFGCAPVGAYPDGASALGVEQLVGDVWEWTSSHFTAYPGYRTFPYPEYSEVFFGTEYHVLRGASWAARPSVARATFRNWDYPIRRQIFAGFRCARDER